MPGSNEGSKFRPGDRVRVRKEARQGHIRTPGYIQGRIGLVERAHGPYLNPESLAHGGSGTPAQPLYMVRFDQPEVWPGYKGAPEDRLCVDIFEHWLEPV